MMKKFLILFCVMITFTTMSYAQYAESQTSERLEIIDNTELYEEPYNDLSEATTNNLPEGVYSSEPVDISNELTEEELIASDKADHNYTNPETGYRVIIEDDANLLSYEDIYSLRNDMIPLTTYGNIAFKSILHNSTTAASYAKDFYHRTFGNNADGTLFLIDMYNRKIWVFSDGNNYNVITTDKANIITDNIYKYATNKEYYKCASSAYSQMLTLLDGGKIIEPMRYASNIVVSLTIAFYITFLVVYKKSNISMAQKKEFLEGCDISLKVSNFSAYKTGTRRVYSPQSDSSSGGGRSGGRWRPEAVEAGGGGHSF